MKYQMGWNEAKNKKALEIEASAKKYFMFAALLTFMVWGMAEPLIK